MFGHITGIDLVFVLVAIVVSMAVHEATHGFVAHWLGDSTAAEEGRLTLNPLKHIDSVTTVLLPVVLILVGLPPIFAAKPVPFNPDRLRYEEFGVAMVGVSGPLVNLLLAALGAVIFHALGPGASQDIANALIIFVEVNVAFFVFNMIPFPPLDGSRLLYAFAPEPLQEVMRQIEGLGFMAILIFILVIFQFASGPIISIENGLINFLLA